MYIHRRTWEGNTHSTVRMETLGSVQYYQGFGVIEESSFTRPWSDRQWCMGPRHGQ